jgi:transposase
MTRPRRHFRPEQKVALLREHLVDKVPVPDLCQRIGIAVSLFHLWQQTSFENGQAACTANAKRRKTATDTKDPPPADLQAKLQRQQEVLSELREEHVRLTKARGEL